MRMHASKAIVSVAAVLCVAGTSLAQVGPRLGQYPDVIVSSVGGSYDSSSGGMGAYGAANGWAAYAIGSDSCNIGSHAAIWMDTGTYQNQHPVIGGQIYRLFNGRFEQIGMSWLKHGFCAADSCSTGNSSGGQQGCLNVGGNPPGSTGCTVDLGMPGGGCDWLGFGRATDLACLHIRRGRLTRQDGLDFLRLAPRVGLRTHTTVYPLHAANRALDDLRCGRFDGAAVLVPS